MMRHRLLAVNDDQAVDNLNERRPFDFGAERPVIRLRNDIPFHFTPIRVTLIPSIRVEASTVSAPRPRGRLDSRKHFLLKSKHSPGGLVSQKEPEPGYIKRVSWTVSFGSIKAGLQ